MDDAGTGHDDARAGAAGQVADGAGGIGRGLLVAHADIGQAHLLRCLGERTDREPDHAEHVLHALFLEAFRQQVGAFDLSHVSSCHRAATIGPGTKKSERRSHYAYIAPRQMAVRSGRYAAASPRRRHPAYCRHPRASGGPRATSTNVCRLGSRLRGNDGVRARVDTYTFSMISICAPSGHSTKQTCRPLLGGNSSRMRTPFFCSCANVPG